MDREQRKCIAVIISKPERGYQEGLLRGICRSAFSNNMNVAVFATTLLEGMAEHQWGEQKLFDLIRFDKFAGIIYAIDTFYGHEVTQELNKRLLKAHRDGIPVVTIDGQVEGLPCFINDDTSAVESVLLHLIREHGIRDIAYMTGRSGIAHAENSLKTFRNVMARFELPILSDRTYYGDYWYNEAENFVEQLTGSRDGLPQAIVCANEYMAIGVYRALHARGIYVPEHILLGCTTNDTSCIPYLLAAENSPGNTGYAACESIAAALRGMPQSMEPQYIASETSLKVSIGCGCVKSYEYNYSEDRGILIDTVAGYFSEFNSFREATISKGNYASLFREVDANLQDVSGFRGIYFCMCDGWDDPLFYIQDTRRNDYTDRIQLFYCHEDLPDNPELYIDRDRYFPREEMFPRLFDASGEPSVYLFRSLHFLDRIFGYVVLDNAQAAKMYDYPFNFWLRDVENGLEAQCRLQSINYVYYKDVMTGLYNRNGFNTLLKPVLQDAVSNRQHVLVALADMNGLKFINDTFGHEEGDTAIKASAALLKSQKIPHATYEQNFRIGGDEFVKIAIGDFTEQAVRDFKDTLYETVAEFSRSSGKPYRTQMSLGICFRPLETAEEMDALLSQADKEMYQEKKRLKQLS